MLAGATTIASALREHSYTNPQAVQRFLPTLEEKLVALPICQGTKQLKRIGMG